MAKKEERYMSLRQAAAELGIHPTTLTRLIEDGEGPPALVIPQPRRNMYRIDRAALERWIRSHTRGAA